jgi:hypothetical protein
VRGLIRHRRSLASALTGSGPGLAGTRAPRGQ